MFEKKTELRVAILPDDHVEIVTWTWVEEDGVPIGEKAKSMEQIERLQMNLHAYPERVQTLACFAWGYASIAEYDAERAALIAAQEAEAANQPTP